ncbi:class I SAM-dependent methyltransferase [Halapricum hydrolyticum]|uniref:Class I SAM-dependent methyltransferase n=1 Tax=Halapricum hydrolyticum TaxID=2979991 RepID=A0AAE3LEU5_9EURY|nr:class I SAM-dependent methyltransferase [Halapricum hydrolyticum]MCU4717629.1 class I SAM-dependent methyltransferase [Halapricum hydrolyticum]MCU4726842.1 class I SAM-dependent methyltransferase [Halapricum hydrolyticum]
MDDTDARDVRETYEEIADHFSKTRAYPWPEVETFVEEEDPVAVGLDLGCGNGRHVAVLAERADRVVALDASRNLLGAARDRIDDPGMRLVQGDAARLPLRADSVGLAVYVATLHHLPSREHRRESLDELARVLGADGRGLVSVWSTAHDRFDADPDAETGFDTTIDWTLPDGSVVPRFYHIYAPAEFEADLEASQLQVESVRVSSGNCYAEVQSQA